jgi:hypothetical protein
MATFAGSINDIKSKWFAAQGFASNTLNGQISAYLAANGGGKSNTLQGQWGVFLASKGRTGSFRDMYRAELVASLSGASSNESIVDLERKFFGDSTSVFA